MLRAYPRCDQKTAIAFIDHTLSKLPFQVERVQTDNGSEFGTSFHWHLLDKGIDHVKIKPRTPRLNGKVERSHRSGRTTTTTIALTALLAPKHLTSAFVRKPKTRCHRPSSVAQSDERAHRAIK